MFLNKYIFSTYSHKSSRQLILTLFSIHVNVLNIKTKNKIKIWRQIGVDTTINQN